MPWYPQWIKPAEFTGKVGLLVFLQVICVAALVITGPVVPSSAWLRIIAILCLAVVFWSFWSMRGNRWSIFPEAGHLDELVESGPFRWIRHPMYSALIVVALVWLIDRFTGFRLAVWLVLTVDLIIKTGLEEKHLAVRFPNYPDYRRRTKRLIPFVF